MDLSLFFCNWIFSQGWNDRGSVWTRSVEIMQQYLCSSNHSIVLVALYHIFFLNSWVWSPGEDLWQWETSAVKWCLSTQGDQELILTLFIMQGYNHLTLLITTGRETVRYWHFFLLFLFWIQFLQLSDQISVLIIKLNKKQNHHNPESHQIRTPSVSVCSNMYTNMYP